MSAFHSGMIALRFMPVDNMCSQIASIYFSEYKMSAKNWDNELNWQGEIKSTERRGQR